MRNNYLPTIFPFAKAAFILILIVSFCSSSESVCAQTLYRTVSASQLNIDVDSTNEVTNEIKSEGAYLIKDGQLDEIYSLKFNLPTSDKKITFEQTHVMVLPMMGMVHLVGTLDIDGVRDTTSFQLGFLVNNDQSITFKGTKSIRVSDLSKDELKLNIDFVLKNNRSYSAIVASK